MINSDKIIKEFKRIQSLGFIKSNRLHNTGIGKTFEDYLGVIENNKKDPDFEDFEIKSQRAIATSYISLFTKSPTFPKGATRLLKESYGKPDALFPNLKVLHTSIFSDKFNNCNSLCRFKITANISLRKIILEAKHLTTDEILSNEIYWDFNDIKGEKLKNTFVIWAKKHKIDNDEYFHYTKAHIYYDFSFDKLILGINNGNIMVDIRYGAYKSGEKAGKPHDHGCGFRVKKENLKDLFEHYIEVE